MQEIYLIGPYLLGGETIDKVVEWTSPGVYALGYVERGIFYVICFFGPEGI